MKVLQLLVLVGVVLLASGQEDCPIDMCATTDVAVMEASVTDSTRHYYLGGMFNVHDVGEDPYICGAVRTEGIIALEAFFWAIGKYGAATYPSTNPDPVSVGGFAMDSCSRDARTLENIYSFETCRTYYTGVSPRNTIAFVGPETNTQATELADLLREMKRTYVSNGARNSMMTDDSVSYFLRTIPSYESEAKAMVGLLSRQGVQYVQVVYKGEVGHELLMAFEMHLADGMCITQTIEAGENGDALRRSLKESLATKVVLLFANSTDSRSVLEMVNADSSIRNVFTFIGTSYWGNDINMVANLNVKAITFKLDTGFYPNVNDVSEFWARFFQLKPDSTSTAPTANVNSHNPWFAEFWEEMFNCRLDQNGCDVDNQNLNTRMPAHREMDNLVSFTLMAVQAIIRGTRAASQQFCQNDHLCSDILNINRQRGPLLYNNILEATPAASSQLFFHVNGTDVNPFFDKYNIYETENGTYSLVLRYGATSTPMFSSQGSGTFNVPLSSACQNSPCLECNEVATTTQKPPTVATTKAPGINIANYKNECIQMFKDDFLDDWRDELLARTFMKDQEFTGIWRDNQNRSDDDYKTRFQYDHDWIIALGVCAGLGIVCVLVFEIYIVFKLIGTKIGKQWRTMWLGQLLLFGIFIAYLVLFAYMWIPSKVTCGITRFGVGVAYAMCFAVLLVKLMVLLTSKTTSDTLLPGDIESPNYLRGIYQFLMYLFIVGVQVVIAIQWLIMVPPDAVQVVSNNGDHVWICNHYTWKLEHEYGWRDMTLFVRTNFENHLISLTYVMFLILLTVIIAMKAHGIITNHRESVFIGISAGFSVPVFVAWGLVGGLNKNHAYAQEFGDACFAFGLFIVATIILFAMFLPKVRQLVNMGVEGIYLEDDRDTYYAGSVVMSPPSYKSRPSSVVYVNSNGGYNEPVIIGDANTMHLKHPGSNYSAPVYVKRPESTIGAGSGKVLRMTGDLTGKHPRDNRKSTSEIGYAYAGSGYGTYKKSRSESGGTLRRAHSTQDLGAL